MQRVLIPHQIAEAAATQRPRGNLSDLYPRWLGSRELILRHRDPYSAAITREIQDGYYGRALDPSLPHDPKDQQAFAYPVFVVFLLAPTVSMPFDIVQPAFTWFLMLLTAVAVPLWLRVVGWQVGWLDKIALTVLVLGSFQVAQGLKLQQLSLLVAALMASAAASVRRGNLLTAGLLVALTLIKPQLSMPMAGWVLLWAASDWKRRWRLLVGFVSICAVLLVGAELLLPGWLGMFRHAVVAYHHYTGGAQTLLEVLTGPIAGKFLGAMLVVVCAWVGWRARRTAPTTDEFVFATSLVLAVTTVLIPMAAPYNQGLLIPGLFLLAKKRTEVWTAGPVVRMCEVITMAVGVWPWLSAGLLSSAIVVLPREVVFTLWYLPLHSTLAFPICVAALLLILAIRSMLSRGPNDLETVILP